MTKELSCIGRGGRQRTRRGVLFLLEHPDQALTLNPATGQSSIWDDLSTAGVLESRDFILVRALDRGLGDLAAASTTTDPTQWLWGKFHFVTFDSLIPGPGASLSVPPPTSVMFPNGFPRPGEFETVDVADAPFGFPYEYTSGPSERFTVEMDPAGPHGYSTLPGGESESPSSRHHADEAELWRQNQVHLIPRTLAEVVAAEESHLVFDP